MLDFQTPEPELPHEWRDCVNCGIAFDAKGSANKQVCEDCRGFGAI